MSFNKRKLHHYWRGVGALKVWQLVIILFLMLLVSATLLRLNNLGMAERRAAVLEADKAGDDAATTKALQALQSYVNAHMNTGLGEGVYLETSYTRARDAALEQATDATNPNSAAYQQASIECQSRFRGGVQSYRNDYVQCVVDQVSAITQGDDPMAGVNLPKANVYRHNFVSPLWSPDLAGFSVLLSLLIVTLIIGKVIFSVVAKLLLKKHYHSFNS